MLKIVGFENEVLREFTLTKKFNHHSECYFRVNIGDHPKEDFLNKLGQQLIIEDGECLFFGKIIEVSAKEFYSYTDIIIRAFSYSIQLDLKPHKRIFQNPDKTLKSIVDFIQKDNNFQVICDVEDKIPDPVLQCEETDFAFLVRMAHTYGKQILVDDNEKLKSPLLVIMDLSEESVIEINQELEQSSCSNIYLENINGEQEESELLEIVIKNQYINVGQRVKIDKKIRYTTEVNIFLEDGIIKCKYLLYELNKIPLWQPPALPEYVSLKATVEDNNDKDFMGRIKVRFKCDYQDAEPDKQMWIPYKTPYFSKEGGFIFLPDYGDTIEVNYHHGSFLASGILGEIPIKEDFRNTKNKYIANIFGKHICFKEDQLEVNSSGNTLILSEKFISINVKDTKLFIEDGKIILETNKNKLCIDNNIHIDGNDFIIQTNTTNIETTTTKIKANHEINIEGEKIYLK